MLWLLRFPPASEENLRAEAEKLGVDPSRLIFSDVASKEEHIKRCQLPDLFLDTEFCGVTTSCDVLWSGTPMISKMGENLHNRVGGSLLTSCGLSELAVSSWSSYKALAVKLAMDDRTLLAHRFNLEMNRETCELVDTQKWVYNLEHGILQIVHGHEKGHPNKDVVCDFTYKKSRRPSLK